MTEEDTHLRNFFINTLGTMLGTIRRHQRQTRNELDSYFYHFF